MFRKISVLCAVVFAIALLLSAVCFADGGKTATREALEIALFSSDETAREKAVAKLLRTKRGRVLRAFDGMELNNASYFSLSRLVRKVFDPAIKSALNEGSMERRFVERLLGVTRLSAGGDGYRDPEYNPENLIRKQALAVLETADSEWAYRLVYDQSRSPSAIVREKALQTMIESGQAKQLVQRLTEMALYDADYGIQRVALAQLRSANPRDVAELLARFDLSTADSTALIVLQDLVAESRKIDRCEPLLTPKPTSASS